MPSDHDTHGHAIGEEADLRAHYHPAPPAVLDKVRPQIDPKAAELIGAAPFFVLATASPSGVDASPRGGPPGFVAVLDERRLAFGDLSGNNRLDSYANIVERADVGLLFLVPGMGETLRVNGRATVTTDPSVLARTAVDGAPPKVAVVVEVEECFVHCAKALRRSGLWEPASWTRAISPTAAEVIIDQLDLDLAPAVIEDALEEDYRTTLWQEGGR